VYEADQQHSFALGADAFLPKPIQAVKLFRLLGDLLKLTWLYQLDEADAALTPADELALPPADFLQQALHLAQLGDIEALRHHLNSLQTGPYAHFAAQPLTLLKQFELEKLTILLRKHLNNAQT
jgi:hypothetical protein